MKKLFTLITAVVVAVAANAGTTYYANYIQLHATPAGAGQVYVDDSSADDEEQWQEREVAEFQYVTRLNSFYLHAKANEGWQFAGYAETALDEEGNPIYTEDIFSTDEVTACSYNGSTISGDSESAVEAMMPLDPNRVYLALFTHVKPATVEGFDSLGSVSIDKIINYVGDEVTLTATPNTGYDPTATFEYWEEASTGNHITDATFTTTVDRAETYTAHFTGDQVINLSFPEEGGFLLFWNKNEIEGHSFPDNVWNVTFNLVDSIYNGDYLAAATVDTMSHYFWDAATPVILWGHGDAKVLTEGNSVPDSSLVNGLNTAWEDFVVDTMAVTYKYYTIDMQNRKFDLIQQGEVVENGSYFMTFESSLFDESFPTPEVIYWTWDEDFVAGIEGITADDIRKAREDGKIYNLQGMEVTHLGKGIYIINGKKIYNK